MSGEAGSGRPNSGAPRLGIIAGGGTAPRTLIENCQKQGRAFFVIAIEGQADDAYRDVPSAWIPFGGALKLKKLVIDNDLKEIVLIGRVRRPSLLELKPDWLALKVVTKIGINVAGDNTLLTGIGKAMEEETGARVVGAHEVFGGFLSREGIYGSAEPDPTALSDIERGREVAEVLGRLDVGQSVIVQQGIVLGVEAIEGTDALIERSAKLRREGPGGVLIKLAKPQQDDRFDLPTIGPATVARAKDAGLRGIAIEAGRSLLIDRNATVEGADKAGIFILGYKPKEKT